MRQIEIDSKAKQQEGDTDDAFQSLPGPSVDPAQQFGHISAFSQMQMPTLATTPLQGPLGIEYQNPNGIICSSAIDCTQIPTPASTEFTMC